MGGFDDKAGRGSGEAVTIEALARRPFPGEPVAPGAVRLSVDVLEAFFGMDPQVIRVIASGGRSVLGVVERSDRGSVNGTVEVHLGRLLWPQLHTKPGDKVLVTCVAADAACNVDIVPPMVLSKAKERRVVAALRDQAIPVWSGGIVHVRTSESGDALVMHVRSSKPPVSVIGPGTEITFGTPDVSSSSVSVTLAEVGGMDAIIDRLHETLVRPLTAPETFWRLGIAPPRGVLLHGPPGTGKTLVARAVAAALQDDGVHLLPRAATELVGTYAGETEAHLRALFSEAVQHAPSLIVLDEIDVLATHRSDLASQSDVRATSQLLSLLDGLERVDGVMVLGTTNRVDVIDPAFRRPGRFDVELLVPTPGVAARREILHIHTRDMPLTRPAEELLNKLASKVTAGFTGADLMSLARETGLAAYRRVTASGGEAQSAIIEALDLESALERVAPSLLRGQRAIQPMRPWEGIAGLAQAKAQLAAAAEDVLAGGTQEGMVVVGPSGNGKTMLVRALADKYHLPLIEVDPASLFTQWLGKSEGAVNERFSLARASRPSLLVIEHLDAIVPHLSSGPRERADDRVHAALASTIDQTLMEGGVLVVGITDALDRVAPSLVRRGRLGLRVVVDLPDELRRREIIQQALTESGREIDDAVLSARVAASEGWDAAAIDAWAGDP